MLKLLRRLKGQETSKPVAQEQSPKKEERVDREEGIFQVSGESWTDSSSMCYISKRDISYTTTAKVEDLVDAPIPSVKIGKGTLLVLINENGEGLGRFPRALSEEEKSRILGNQVNYSERDFYYFEDMGISHWDNNGTYKIEVVEGPNKGFCLEESVSKSQKH